MTDPLHETGRISITAGMARAMCLHGAARQCASCKFGFPKYPGRYPSKCPRCGEAVGGQVNEGTFTLDELKARGRAVLDNLPQIESRAHNLQRLLSESGRIQRSEMPFFMDEACSQFLLIPYDLIEDYGGVEGFKVWLEGPVGTIQDEPAFYRVESMDDPVLVFTFLDEHERCRAFATTDPTRYLGFDPRAEMVNEDHDATFLAETTVTGLRPLDALFPMGGDRSRKRDILKQAARKLPTGSINPPAAIRDYVEDALSDQDVLRAIDNVRGWYVARANAITARKLVKDFEVQLKLAVSNALHDAPRGVASKVVTHIAHAMTRQFGREASALAEAMTDIHSRIAGFVGEDKRASIYRQRKPGEGATQIRGGFRFHVGHNKDR